MRSPPGLCREIKVYGYEKSATLLRRLLLLLLMPIPLAKEALGVQDDRLRRALGIPLAPYDRTRTVYDCITLYLPVYI